MTAVRTGAQLYTPSEQLPRRGRGERGERGGTPHYARFHRRNQVAATSSPGDACPAAGLQFWAHDASPSPNGSRRAHHGPGGYCRPSGF